MDTKKIRVLLDALETGSLLKSAERMGYTPSGLAHMMDAMEKEMGIRIIERGRFGIRLTPEGERLLPLLKNLVRADKELTAEIGKIQALESKRLRIGASLCLVRPMLWQPMATLRERHPNIEVEIVTRPIEELYAQLDAGELDLCCTIRMDSGKYEFLQVMEDPFYAVLPKDYPLKPGADFPLRDFHGRPFIMPSFGKNADIQEALARNGIEPKICANSAEDPAVIALVAAGIGVSMLTDAMLQDIRREAQAEVRIAPLDPPVKSYPGVAARSFRSLSLPAKRFVNIIREQYDL